MGQTAQLRLIRDGFIAGHNSCDLRRHLDSAPPETPIRDVVDRCRVWESHADPAINRTRKPTMDTLYPTFTVGGAESNYDITKVAVVTDPKSDQNKLMDVIRRTLANTEIPEPEIQEILEQLQLLLRESDVGIVIRWTATTAATASTAATTAPKHDRGDLFFMWTAGTYGDALP